MTDIYLSILSFSLYLFCRSKLRTYYSKHFSSPHCVNLNQDVCIYPTFSNVLYIMYRAPTRLPIIFSLSVHFLTFTLEDVQISEPSHAVFTKESGLPSGCIQQENELWTLSLFRIYSSLPLAPSLIHCPIIILITT